MAALALLLSFWVGCEGGDLSGLGLGQAHRPSFLSPAKFDDCAGRFADALRRWPVADRADAPVLLAEPRWRNESSVRVRNGQAFARRLAQAVNLRTGAKVRIVHPDTIGCRYATELVLLPAVDQTGQSVLVLTWRVIRPGSRTLSLEEACTVRRLKATASSGSLFAPPAKPSSPTERPYQYIAFAGGRVGLDSELADGKVIILGERTRRDVDGRMRIELRLLSRTADTPIEALPFYVDGSGKRYPSSKTVRYALEASKPKTVTLTLPKAARSYEVLIVAR